MATVPVHAYEVSPAWPDGGGNQTAIGNGLVGILTAAAVVATVTLHHTISAVNAGLPGEPAKVKLYDGGKSEPLSMTLGSVYALARETSIIGGILLFAYMCEHYPLFPHSAKIHDMDMFWLVHLALGIASVWRFDKSKTADLLNREQTEEWKGWMQFSFLMYHYFSAHETYNAIRVMCDPPSCPRACCAAASSLASLGCASCAQLTHTTTSFSPPPNHHSRPVVWAGLPATSG